MVFEHQGEYPSQWKAIESIALKLSISSPRASSDAHRICGLLGCIVLAP